MSAPRRRLTLVTVACLAGAGLALWASSRTWVVDELFRPAPLPPQGDPRSGGDLAPPLPALALVALASAGGLLATRSWARLVVGVVMGLAGIGVGVAAVRAGGVHGVNAVWPTLCVIGAVLVVAAAVITVLQGRHWPAMGARYERVTTVASTDSAPGMWDAIDRGQDPTSARTDDGENDG